MFNLLAKIKKIMPSRKAARKGLAVLLILLLVSISFPFVLIRDSLTANAAIDENAGEGNAMFINENPTFRAEFGDRENPTKQRVRFQAAPSKDNPFAKEISKEIKETTFLEKAKEEVEQAKEKVLGKKQKGVEMSLVEAGIANDSKSQANENKSISSDSLSIRDHSRGSDLSPAQQKIMDDLNQQLDEIASESAEVEARLDELKGDVKEITTQARKVYAQTSLAKENDKDVVKNIEVVEGVDLEYEILAGKGIKEELILKKPLRWDEECLTAIRKDSCAVPPNTFKFLLKLDEGVQLHQSIGSVNQRPTATYYFTDENGNYLGHFLPPFAVDRHDARTNNVRLEIVKSDTINSKELSSEESIVNSKEGIVNGESKLREDTTISRRASLSQDNLQNNEEVSQSRALRIDQSAQAGGDVDSSEYSRESGTQDLERPQAVFDHGPWFSLRGISDLGSSSVSRLLDFGRIWFNPLKTVFAAETDQRSDELLHTQGEEVDSSLSTPHSSLFTLYSLTLTVDLDWLLSKDRAYPIRIDPSIVHDTEAEFDAGSALNRVESIAGPKVQTAYHELPADEHTVGLWHFNEGTPNTCAGGVNDVCDSSGNGNDGAFNGNAAFTTSAKLGSHAVTFNGTGDYISTTFGPATLNETYTVMAWFKRDTLSANNAAALISGGYGGDPAGIMIHTDDYAGTTGEVHAVASFTVSEAYKNGKLQLGTSFVVPNNEWVHIAFVGTVNDNTTNSSGGTDHWIGANNNNTNHFDGIIDEVAIYNRALSPEEIAADAQRRPYGVYTSSVLDSQASGTNWNDLQWTENGVATGDGETPYSTNGLVAQWNFNETSGTTAANSAGAGSCGGTPANCNGTLVNMTTTGQDAAAGDGWTAANRKWGAGALMFDGTNGYVSLSDTNALTFGDGSTDDPMTIEMWVKPESYGGRLFVKDDASGREWFLLTGSTGIIQWGLIDNSTGGYIARQAPNLDDYGGVGQWNHIVATYDGGGNQSGIKIYYNGVQRDNSNESVGAYTAMENTAQDPSIGADPDATSPFDGTIDSVRIYSRALTADEILSNYNAGQIEFQTRTGTTTTPDSTDLADGTYWEKWKPTTSESQIEDVDDDVKNWELAGAASVPGIPMQTVDVNPTAPSGPTGCSNNKPVLINNLGSDDDLTNYQVKLEVEYLTGMSSDFSDLRFTNDAGTDLDYWIESYTASTKATVWVEVDSISGNTSELIYMWYNGCTGGSSSSGDNTFVFYDDFDDNSLDPTKWTTYIDGSGAVSESDQYLKLIINGASETWQGAGAYTTSTFTKESYAIDYKWNPQPASSAGCGENDCGWDGVQMRHQTNYRGTTYYGDQNQYVIGLHPNAKSGVSSRLAHDGGSTLISDGLSAGTWYTMSLRITPSNVDYYLNNNYKGSHSISDSVWTNLGSNIRFEVYHGEANIQTTNGVDSFKVRRYSPPEPTANVITKSTQPYIEGTGSMKTLLGAPQVDSSTVALWHLDETNGDLAAPNGCDGTAADVCDETSNNNNGEIVTGTTVVDGIYGKARDFAGDNPDYIQTSSTGFDQNIGTVELWFKRTGSWVGDEVFWDMRDANTLNPPAAYWDASGLHLFGNGVDILTYSFTPAQGVWYHLAMTYDFTSDNYYMYLDGAQVASSTSLYTSGTIAPNFTIGARFNGVNGIHGTIDEIRVSNIARSAEEIAEAYRAGRDHRLSRTISSTDLSSTTKLPFYVAADRPGTYMEAIVGESAYVNYEPDANTIGLWHLEEESGSGAYIKDSSGNGNDGTPTGTTFVQGKIGKGRDFDGTDDKITIPDSNSLDMTTFTIELWLKASSTGAYTTLVDKFAGWTTTGNWSLHSSSNGTKARWGIRSSTSECAFDSNKTIFDSQWHHIVAIHNESGDTLYLYIDGVLDSSLSCGGSMAATTADVTIGTRPDNSQDLDGTLDEVRISNVARTADEIRQAYEVGRRTHPITIDFAASGDSGDLITGSSDTGFTVDATAYGATNKGDNLFAGDKIIVKENVAGTEYIAQGTVDSVNASTGAVTVASWDSGSTFPTGGFTANASFFKWQREYFPVTGSLSTHRDAVTRISLRVTDGSEGRTVWLDDFESAGPYLTAPAATGNVASTAQRYMQYRAIISSWDPAVTSYLSSVTANYCYDPPNSRRMRHWKWWNDVGTQQSFLDNANVSGCP